MRSIKNFYFLFLALILPALTQAQSISGLVTSSDGPVIGATVSAGSNIGTVTDVDGKFTLALSAGTHKVTFSYIGYVSQSQNITLTAGENRNMNITLAEDVTQLGGVVIVGSRTQPRSVLDTPLPVDILSSNDLKSTGQTTFDKALQYRVPSFNTVQTPVNDATSLLDPYEIRNMGPSRTLILINGKRKNLSALLYTQTSPGRGETGADISAIPTDAIKRVEILRDGASAQYGSDAIAGVMNIILNDGTDGGSVTLKTGMTGEGDGEMVGVSLNNGTSLGDGKGFLNYTVDLSKVNLANRPGTVDAAGEAADFGAPLASVQSFLALKPDAGNINGSPETTASKFLVNGGFDLNENVNVYANAAYVYKKVNSFANYRTPYWRTLTDFPYLADFFPNGPGGTYVGYVPTFDGDLNDYNGTVGFKSKQNGWIYDVSFTTGGNRQTYRVRNSHNRNFVYSPAQWIDANSDGIVDPGESVPSSNLYRENSQVSFDPGGTQFNHSVGNIDISKVVSDQIGIAFGSEFRSETFTVIEGELSSYDGGGADSFAGNRPENSGKFNRYNFGGYFDVAFDVTKDFLLNGTARVENYSDFGSAFVWKVSSRYKFMDDKITLRGSVSTGFRAPTLHQIYTQKAQYSFIPGQGIQVGGLVSNVSREATLLKIPQLDAETSSNVTVGVGARISEDFNLTVDYYNIAVSDRIVLSNEIIPPGGPAFQGLSDISFFVNALDTQTEGIDVVANYKTGVMKFNLAGNYTIANRRSGGVNNPAFVSASGQSVVDETQEALFFTSRPKTKWILGIDYAISKFIFSLNNTYFGKTTFQQQGMSLDIRTEFIPKVVTDLSVNYAASEKVNITLNVNNLLNVLPEWEFVAKNANGETLLADVGIGARALTNTSVSGRRVSSTS